MAAASLRNQAESSLRALAAELKRSEGFVTSWLTGGAQHVDVKAATESALAALRGDASGADLGEELARPFLLACAARRSTLCALGFAALQQLAASDALSTDSLAALVDHLAQVDDGDDEQTQLKSLQATLTVLQSARGPAADAPVASLLVTCFRLLSGAGASNAVHATAAATLRQALSVVLERAWEDAPPSARPRASAMLRALCALASGTSAAAPELAAPLPRAFAVDLLDDAVRAHARLFTHVSLFSSLLSHSVFPLLTSLLADGGVAAGLQDSTALQPTAAATAALRDEVGFDPAEVAERRCALRTASTLVCTYAAPLPELTDALLQRVLAAAQRSAAAAWYRCAALEALQRCAADVRLARSLAESQRLHLLAHIATAVSTTLIEVCGANAELTGVEAALQAMCAHFEARAMGQEVIPDVDDQPAQSARCACIAVECVLAQCQTAAQLVDDDARTGAGAVGVLWQPLLPALSLSLGRGHGEAFLVVVLKAHTALTCAAAGAGDLAARDALLQTLCQFAQDATSSEPTPSAEPAAPRPRAARMSTATAAAADQLTPRALHCVRALLNCVLALAPGLSITGWRPVLSALSRVDAALEADRAGAELTRGQSLGERATLATALEQLYAHMAATLSDRALDEVITALRDVSIQEVQEADYTSAVSSAAAGGRRSADGRRLYMLARHAKLVVAVSQRLPHMWPALEAHVAAALKSNAAAVRSEAAAVLGAALQGALEAPSNHRASAAADETAQIFGHPDFTCVLVSSLERATAASPPERYDVREGLLRTLLDVLERHGELLGPAWRPALCFIASSAELAGTDAGPTIAGVAEDATAHAVLAAGFACATAVVQHLLPTVPAALRSSVLATLTAFGHQQVDVNTAVSAVALIWDLADHTVREEDEDAGAKPEGCVLRVLPAAFSALASLSADPRPEIRNSAVRALVAAQVAHAQLLPPAATQTALWEQLLPVARAARDAASGAPACQAQTATAAAAGPVTPMKQGGVQLLLHHSRNTASKQWDETLALCLSGLARVLRVQLATAAVTAGFDAHWATVVELLADAAASPSREVGLAALACLGAVAGLGVLDHAHWARLLDVLERTVSHAACDAVQAELPGTLLRLYAAQKVAFQAEDVQLVLRVALALARAPPVVGRGRPCEGELLPHQAAALDLLQSLLPLPPHLQAQSAALHKLIVGAIAAQVRSVAAGFDAPSTAAAAAAGLDVTYTMHAISVQSSMLSALPARARAAVLTDAAASLAAAGHTRTTSPAGKIWRAALAALPQLLREGPQALHERGPTADAVAAERSWRALLAAAESMLRLGAAACAWGVLAGELPDEPAHEDATQLDADEDAHVAALDALADGALGSAAVAAAPSDVLAGFIALLDASAAVAPEGSTAQTAALLRLANVCTRKLYALASAPAAEKGTPHLAVACLALPALLRQCQALLAHCLTADAPEPGAPWPVRDAALCALEAVGELQPDARVVDAAVLHAQQSGLDGATALRALLPSLRSMQPRALRERTHLLLLYGPLVRALDVRDARLRTAVTGLLVKTGRALALIPQPEPQLPA